MPTGIGSLLYTIVLSYVNLFLGFLQIFATQVLAQRLPQKCADDEDDDHKKNAVVNFMTLKMIVEFEEGYIPDTVMPEVEKNCKIVEDDCEIFWKK